MGGAIALSVTLACQDAAANAAGSAQFRGAVLLAPMTNIAEKSKPSPWVMPLLQGLACMPLIRSIGFLSPSGLDPDKQYAGRSHHPTHCLGWAVLKH